MSKDTEDIINEVFQSCGLKLSADDPIVAVLLYISQRYKGQNELLKAHEEAFFLSLDQRFQRIHEVYEALEQQKQHIRLDLITHTQRLVRKEVKEQVREQYKQAQTWIGLGFALVLLLQIFILARML